MVYQGSKTKYSKYIIPILQKLIDDGGYEIFIDGMCGGCNIIQDIKADYRIAMDLNSDLIELYKYAIQGGEFPETITREDWDRAKAGEGEPWWRALVCFFASYSARGWAGGFALGGDRDYYHERLRNFTAQIPKLQDVNFLSEDINNLFAKKAVIYLDPPYKNTKKYDISKNFDYEKFWNTVRKLSEDNIVVVSEQVAPEDFKPIWTLKTNRNCFGSGLSKEISDMDL